MSLVCAKRQITNQLLYIKCVSFHYFYIRIIFNNRNKDQFHLCSISIFGKKSSRKILWLSREEGRPLESRKGRWRNQAVRLRTPKWTSMSTCRKLSGRSSAHPSSKWPSKPGPLMAPIPGQVQASDEIGRPTKRTEAGHRADQFWEKGEWAETSSDPMGSKAERAARRKKYDVTVELNCTIL